MKKNEVQIIVAGTSGSGKSTVVQLIRDALANAGLSFTVKPMPGENPFVHGGFQDDRINAVAKKSTIVLEERQVRQSLTSHNYETVSLADKES